MDRIAPARRERGFTIIETMVVGFLFLLLALFGLPALDKAIARGKIQGSAREAAVLMQLARFEAVKRSRVAGVAVRYATGELIAFIDNDPNRDRLFTPGLDQELGRYQLPSGIAFWGPTDSIAGEANAMSGFDNTDETEDGTLFGREPQVGDGGEVLFRPDGSCAATGAVRVRDGRDNFLETRVAPAATARIFVQKYDGDGPPDDLTNWDEPGEAGDGDDEWAWN
jgi:type II secretory pathway pseudopilin PulG